MNQRREDGTGRPRRRLPWLHHRSLPWLAFGLYMALTTALLIGLGVPLPPDRYFLVLLVPVLFIRRARAFVLDWSPFLLLLFSYEFLRGLAGRVGQVHYLLALRFDERVFGTAPTVWLQQHFAHSTPAPYDYVAAVLYLLHFVAPLTFAFTLWMRSREEFARFTSSFLVLSYAALATFVVFPAAPPWLASRHGYLPDVHEQVGVVLSAFPSHFDLPTVYQLFDPNQVAAIPSLHAAYPLLLVLFACRFFGARALLLAPYVLGVWVAVVYMGEHYIFDVAVGAVYSVAAFVMTDHVLLRLRRGRRTIESPAPA
ncbi:MAG TPA: phosphatase PAP2 family protein [Terriglobales bacterium]|nr:phosphatase PAP2 family protein [Terriglobales bacterium]